MANENDTQWEDIDNNQETADEDDMFDFDDSNEESSDDFIDDENGSDSEQNEEDEDASSIKAVDGAKNKKIILIALIAVIFIIIILLIVKLAMGNSGEDESTSVPVTNQAEMTTDNNQPALGNEFFEENSNMENSDMMSVNFNDNGEASVVGIDVQNQPAQGELVATVANADGNNMNNTNSADSLFGSGFDDSTKQAGAAGAQKNNAMPGENLKPMDKSQEDALDSISGGSGNTNNSIVVSWNRVRQNPFKAPAMKITQDDKYEKFGDVQFEIIEPPTKLVPDQNLSKLLQTQISGILYDDESPSAIVNLAGQDQFVKIGDEISGYKIKNITRNKVEISYKNNTYVASVGELFVPGKLEEQSAVANLSQKFAGRYKNEK